MKIMRSKVVALVVAIMMVFSLVAVPVSAADEAAAKVVTSEDAAKFLNEKELLQGDESGDLMLDKDLTREQMMVIVSRLLGVEDEAKDYSVEEMTFQDVPATDEYAPYVAWAQANGITQGHSEEVFGFGEALTAWQTKAFFVRALGYVDTEDEEVAAKADELGLTAGSEAEDKDVMARGEMAVLMYNTVYAVTAEGEVLGEALGVVEPAKPVLAVLEVKEAKLVAEDTLNVVFNRAVEDTTKVTFAVTGAMVVSPTVAWDEAKTTAALKSAGIFLDGNYTVKVSGDTFAEGKDKADFVVAKNGIAKIEILSDKLVRTNDDHGIVKIKLTDFYGKDVTEKMAYDVETKTSRGTALVTEAKTGTVTIDTSSVGAPNNVWSNYPVTPELVTLTVYAKTAVNGTVATANAVLKVTELARVDKIELSQPVLPSGATKVVLGKAEAAYMVVSAKDQFGNEVKDIDQKLNLTHNNTEVFYSVSDSTIKTSKLTLVKETTANNVEEVRLKLATTSLDSTYANRKITIQVISKYTASASNVVTIDLKQGKTPYRVTLGAPEQLVAVGDTFDETLVIPMNVYDEDGVQLTADEIADNYDDFTVSGDASVFGITQVKTSGANKGKLVGTTAPSSTGIRSVIVSINNSTTAPATMTVDVKERAKARTLRLKQTPASNLLYNSTVKYSYEILDQYGRVMEDDMLNYDANNAGGIEASEYTKVVLTLSDDSKAVATAPDDSNRFPASDDGNGTAEDVPEASVTVQASAINDLNTIVTTAKTTAGSVSMKAELKEFGTNNVVSTDSRSFSVTEGVPSSLTFEIADTGNIYAYPAGDSGNEDMEDAYVKTLAAAKYAKALTITAKDANGNSFAVPFDRILSVSTSSGNTLDIAKGVDADILAHQNKVVVWSNQATAFPSSETAVTKTATVTITVGTDNGPKAVTKEITVAKAGPKAQEVLFLDTNIAASTKPYELPTTYKEVKEIVATAAELTDDNAARVFYVVTKDQYGVYANPASPEFSVVNIDKTTVRTMGYDAQNTLNEASARVFTATNTFRTANIILMYTVNGVYNTLNVKATDGVVDGGTLATDLTAPTVTVVHGDDGGTATALDTIAASGTFTVTFSELLSATGKANVEAAFEAVDTDFSYAWNDTTFVLTVTNTNAGAAATFAADVTATLYDVDGNVSTAQVVHAF